MSDVKVNKTKYDEPYVRVIDPLQFKLYMKHGVKPIDFYYNNHMDKVVYVFTVRETQELYVLWKKRELK